MSLPTAATRLARAAERGLTLLNSRHPWDHNAHFHPWILRSLPEGAGQVLEVGCGRGELLAALAARSDRVEGIDPDPTMAYTAATRVRQQPRVGVRRRSLTEHAADPDRAGRYDAVIMLASLHHMDAAEALVAASSLLRAGGRLLIVTPTRPQTALDHAWEILSALTNPLIGLVEHPRPVPAAERSAPPAGPEMPVRDPDLTHAQLCEAAAEHLPGSRIRRREGFRVTLRWQKPQESTD